MIAAGDIDEIVQLRLNEDPPDTSKATDPSGGGNPTGVCDILYGVAQDASFNVVGTGDFNFQEIERDDYTPYGERTVYFSPGTNDPDCHAPTQPARRVSADSWVTGTVQHIEISQDIVLNRYVTEGNTSTSGCFTVEVLSPAEARRRLALPNDNKADQIQLVVLRKDAQVYVGTAKDMSSNTTIFHPDATGVTPSPNLDPDLVRESDRP